MKKVKKPITNPSFEEDANQPAKGANLADIVKSANELVDLREKIEAMELELKELSDKAFKKSSEELPALMTAAGMKDFTLASGVKIVIKPVCSASLPSAGAISKAGPDDAAELKERFEKGCAYLENSGAASIIRNNVVVPLGKDSEKVKEAVVKAMKALRVPFAVQKTVNPQTLTSWVKERLKDGKPVDMDLFKVFVGECATIEAPKGGAVKPTSRSKASDDVSLF